MNAFENDQVVGEYGRKLHHVARNIRIRKKCWVILIELCCRNHYWRICSLIGMSTCETNGND